MNNSKTRLIVLEVSNAQSPLMQSGYGEYRFLTFCDKSYKLLENYVLSSFERAMSHRGQKDVNGYIAEWSLSEGVHSLDENQLKIIFDNVLILHLENNVNYDDSYYSQAYNEGYLGWLNKEVDLTEFFED